MKTKVAILALVGVLGGRAGLSQASINGIWQGEAIDGKTPDRLVIQITSKGSEAPTASITRLDYEARDFPASVKEAGDSVEVSSPIVGQFTGKLSSDRSTITGSWAANGKESPLVLHKATWATAWPTPKLGSDRSIMPEDADPAFEVAAIRRSAPNGGFAITNSNGRLFYVRNHTLIDLIAAAYRVHPRQVMNAPEWSGEKFDISGTQNIEGMPSPEQRARILQKILASRFGLQIHTEKREFPVYFLESVQPKFLEHAGDLDGRPSTVIKQMPQGGADYFFINRSMNDLVSFLMNSSITDREVIDHTEINGSFNFDITFALKPLPDQDVPNIFEALRSQLGLKLRDASAPIDVIVIDHVERPGEN